ncbi:hypothetical protein DM02DRAFT_658536 [Periconia macrospinosa]|uniref:Uncharacterized protein n=1 Tax=Periconia macrospinosa TaxID=97972 RepID=A0A2V1DGA0_9PLEO|nr:hypothetical protein DM02DRAFT_658536 [Periconia macrospinosa]
MPYCIADILADPPRAFSIAALANITTVINQTCPWDLLRPTTLKPSVAFNLTTGNNFILSDLLGPWTTYPARIIMSRLIDFKLPLLVLIFQLPRPPLRFWVECFALLHLVSSPVDSIASYFFALSECFGVLKKIKYEARRMREVKTDCKKLSLVVIAYATIGKPVGDIAEQIHLQASNPAAFRKAAHSLAADRRINFIPVGAALLGFVVAVLFKYVYIDHKDYDDMNPQHVQIWSLSSSMTVMWAITAVFQASIVGMQKTRDSTRRILCQLEEDLNHRENLVVKLKDQVDHGAVPNYRPDRWSSNSDLKVRSPWTLDLMALAIVATGSLGGVWLAARVPPEGWNCRTGVKVVMFLHYLLGGVVQLVINWLPVSTWPKVYATAILDLLVLSSFTGVIFTTQVGVLNRVGCYVQEISKGVWGVVLPPFTWETVRERLHLEYPAILFGFMGLQIFICLGIWRGFREARQVYRQDDTESVE